jgi:hypothetical protein
LKIEVQVCLLTPAFCGIPINIKESAAIRMSATTDANEKPVSNWHSKN